MDPEKNLFMKLKQFKERTANNPKGLLRKVQAKKSTR